MADDAPPGAPEWVVTYGDMMSLLLTFFIMLVSLSEVHASERYRAVLESLEEYLGYRTAALSPPGRNFPLNSLIAALETLGSFTNQDVGRGGVRHEAPSGRELRTFRTREGERVRVGRPIVFAHGETELSGDALDELRRIADDLAGKLHKIEIRAHASAGAAGGGDPTLVSYRRGRAVLQALEELGLARDRLRITAAADTEPPKSSGDQPIAPADRVEVLTLDEYAGTYAGPAETTR